MQPKSPKWLDDIADACRFILESAADATLADYESDRLLRQAIERNLEIIGEALLRLERTDPETAARLSDVRKVIGLRNRLAHAYGDTDNHIVWKTICEFLPVLRRETEALVREAESE
jgi:uncharacterized protein with HEPN domain